MQIQYLADIHREFMTNKAGLITPDSQSILDQVQACSADVLVIAGDLWTKRRTIELAAELAQGRPCVVVAGNHDFYDDTIGACISAMRQQAKKYPNIHFLENQAVEIEGVVFLGCTLWTDMRLFEPTASYQSQINTVQNGLNDYRLIQWDNRRELRAADTISMHKESVAWLQEQFDIYRGRKIVVVTHHAPSWRSIPDQYQDDIISAGFASRLDDLVEASGATLWIHGHTHGCCDYRIGQTRVVANCCGYPFEQTGFNPGLQVEVE